MYKNSVIKTALNIFPKKTNLDLGGPIEFPIFIIMTTLEEDNSRNITKMHKIHLLNSSWQEDLPVYIL